MDVCAHATRYAGQTSHPLPEQCKEFLRYLKLATSSLVKSSGYFITEAMSRCQNLNLDNEKTM